MWIEDNIYLSQSGTELTYSNMETVKAQNIRFSDQHGGAMTDIAGSRDMLRSATDTRDTTLENFFSRPLKIHDSTWTVGGAMDAIIFPWSEYFTDPRVENRITNYSLIRADLHIKVVINGNGFYYGRGFAAYQPFPLFDTLSDTTLPVAYVQYSQMPKIMIDPTTSMGGEMVIPFHHQENNAEVQTSGLAGLGQIWLRSINNLKCSNESTEPITVTVFAWAENVELSVLTSMDVTGLTPQSGDETDEANAKGVVSGPATTVSKMAGALSSVPIIGPYATATSNAASMVSSVASAMGYCKPNVTKAPEPYRPTPSSTLALTNVPDTAQKLTVDHKQELTIDPIVMGIGKGDVLNIKSIATRESYWYTFPWAMGTGSETLLTSLRVDPVVWNVGGGAYYFPATAAAAMPFQYWSGTMKYRFQFVCSAFHKGRVKIVYDPNQVDGTQYNVNYMKIIDLAEETDVTIEVGMGQSTIMREHYLPGIDVTGINSNAAPLTKSTTKGNGTINVYVVNELTSPSSIPNNDIEVNIYVSAGDDFEVYVPDDHFQSFVFKPQSGDEAALKSGNTNPSLVPDAINTDEPNAPMHKTSENIAVMSKIDDKIPLVFTGESISSFRSLLKRYNRWLAIAPGTASRTNVSVQLNAFPFLRGNVAGAVNTRVGPAQYNFCNTVLLHWVTYMFSARRGSIRYKLLPKVEAGPTVWTVQRQGIDPTNGGYAFSVATSPGLTPGSGAQSIIYERLDNNRSMTGAKGAAYTNDNVNAVLEFEVPYYSKYRFTPGKEQNVTSGSSYDEYFNMFGTINTGTSATYSELWVAAGEDFQTYFFTGLPRMYYEPVAPLSA